MMHMAAFFPSVPSQVNFELLYAAVDGQWRLYGISVNVGQSAPVAPSAPPQTKPVTAAPKKPPVSKEVKPANDGSRPPKE
jgi:hypothetical protein